MSPQVSVSPEEEGGVATAPGNVWSVCLLRVYLHLFHCLFIFLASSLLYVFLFFGQVLGFQTIYFSNIIFFLCWLFIWFVVFCRVILFHRSRCSVSICVQVVPFTSVIIIFILLLNVFKVTFFFLMNIFDSLFFLHIQHLLRHEGVFFFFQLHTCSGFHFLIERWEQVNKSSLPIYDNERILGGCCVPTLRGVSWRRG